MRPDKDMRAEADATDLLARLKEVAGTELSKEASAAIVRLRAENEKLTSVVRELDRLSLVIESAVRWQDPVNYEAVLALLRQNSALLAE